MRELMSTEEASEVQAHLEAAHHPAPDQSESDTETASLPTGSEAPEHIGPYRILQKVGEGGMVIVYEAEQETPVRRRVALKLIKWGMDTKAVVARFEAFPEPI